MASLGNTFDATSVDTTQREFENLPEAVYEFEVEASEIKDTADNTGKRLALTYRVVSGEYENRKVFGGINIVNKNPQAQEIGQKELAALCRAMGLSSIEDSEELHFKSFHARLGLSKKRVVGDKTYEPRNEIKKFYFPDEGGPPESKPATAPAAVVVAAAATAKPAATCARPWGKK